MSHSGDRRFSVALKAAVTHNTLRENKKQNSIHNIHKLKAILARWKMIMHSAALQLTVRNQKEKKTNKKLQQRKYSRAVIRV